MGQRNPAPPMVEILWFVGCLPPFSTGAVENAGPSTVYLTAKGTHSPDSPTNLDGQTGSSLDELISDGNLTIKK